MSSFADGCYSCSGSAELIAKLLACKGTMEYTKAKVGSGILQERQSPKTMTEPAGYVMDARISEITNPVAGECQVTVQILSSEVNSSFHATGILLYAKDPDGGPDVPYTYLVLENDPEPIRNKDSAVGQVATFDLVAVVGAVDSVKATIDPNSLIKAETFDALKDRVEDLEAQTALEIGTVDFSNSQAYPFLGEAQTVSLEIERKSLDYIILTEVTEATGNVQAVEVCDKQTNGFKIRVDGSAGSVTVKYYVYGGMAE